MAKYLRRASSAFGIHFDFHARPGMTVGDGYDPEGIAALLDRVRPDFVQCDTKGHAGLSSYPTEVGYRADVIAEDPLALWRRLTEERNIALYAHHSGLYDCRAAAEHPEWAVVDQNGQVSCSTMSVFGGYCDGLLIPQLKELAGRYRLNGAWIDGDCWAVRLDYSESARRAYAAETGRPLPYPGEPDFENYRAFLRRGFERYVTHYIEEVRREYPDFEITSNWIYSEYMPQRETAPVDFLSGDYSTCDAVNSARHNARCLAAHRLPWDLMAWGQNTLPVSWTSSDRQNKSAVQLMQEAAVCVALGGGFEFFHILYGHGTRIQRWCIEDWGKVADFVRARQPICFGAGIVPQIGVIFPHDDPPPESGRVFSIGTGTERSRAWILALQDSGHASSVLFEDTAAEELARYPMVVLPDASRLPDACAAALRTYVAQGGIAMVDLRSLRYFPDLTGPLPEPTEEQFFLDGGGHLAALCGTTIPMPSSGGEGCIYEDNYYETPCRAACLAVPHGRGKFLFSLFDLGEAYRENRSAPLLAYLRRLIADAGFAPRAWVDSAEGKIDLTLTEKDGRLLCHLMNMEGQHSDPHVRSFDSIPPLYHTVLAIRCAGEPTVFAEPEHIRLPVDYRGGIARVQIPRLEIYSVITVDN